VNGNYNSGSFTPTAVGTYYWTAAYSGDANNEAVTTACGDPGESSVVGKAPSTIATFQRVLPQDRATVSASAGGRPTGTVTFKLFGPADPGCAGTLLFTQTVTLNNGSASTSNTTFSIASASASTYNWVAVYSGDASHQGSTSPCGKEHFTLTIANS
jgi:hypothetical protein